MNCMALEQRGEVVLVDCGVTFDDRGLGGLARVWFEVGTTSQYFPLLHTAFWVESQLWGGAVAGYHAVNVLQHAFSACLICVTVSGTA